MKFDYKLSIIIPCRNSSKTIKRTLNSIVFNDLHKEEYEIVIADDDSTDNFMDIVNEYKDRANIAYYKTNTKIHCPGNTRQLGLENAKGEWITFIDHDDYFEPDVFVKIFNTIEMNEIDTYLFTCFYDVLDSVKTEHIAVEDNIHWLHGKFYNHQMLIDGNLGFKKDLATHEDIYFNNKVKLYMMTLNKEIHAANEFFTYTWVQREDSVSHQSDDELSYIDKHLDDFAYANIMPYIEMPDDYKEFKCHNVLINFLETYFMLQQGLYTVGRDKYPMINKTHMAKYKKIICDEFDITNDDIIKYLYGDPLYFDRLKQSLFDIFHRPFIEIESFKDFILSLVNIKEDE